MDKRVALPAGAHLNFPGMNCQIESEIGRGSNAIVYRAWYMDHYQNDSHEVLIKELFPLDPDGGIFRVEDGGVVCEREGRETYELHRRSFEAGNRVHLELLRRHPDEVGSNLNTYALNGTLYTVLGFNGGCSMEERLSEPAITLRPLVESVIRLLDALEGFHDSGLLHLDIAPDNIMLLGKGQRERVMLIDYNSCQVIDESVCADVDVFSIKQGYTAPEIRCGRYQDIGPCSDLYSVAAIFFRAITGEALTPFQMMRPLPPDVSRAQCLSSMPETVRSWAQAILRRGLCALPSKRYRSVREMREDMVELLDRIDGVGITHWALWEAGWRNVERLIRDNPSLEYIRDSDALYPANAECDGTILPMTAHLEELLSAEGKSALLIAGGGMGKTTALLRTAYAQTRRYATTKPAFAYVSLYGWQAGERDYILNRVLETLRFKSETHSFEDARKTLADLMEHPLPGPNGATPVLLLMLDGLNEAAGDTAPLIDEIARLSRMRGVRILAATRTDEVRLPFRRLCLAELSEEDVRIALSRSGLLMPESAEIRALLKTPLMLSIFIRTSRTEQKQLNVSTHEDLMRAYFSALLEKENSGRSVNDDVRWRNEAALYYVLPTLAQEMHKKGAALADSDLLPAVERCYRLFHSKLSTRAFPQWIGRSSSIQSGSKDAEEWYGIIVHDILWKRLGLLIRDDLGRYQVSHQLIGEYLLSLERGNHSRIIRIQWLRRGLATSLAIIVAMTGVLSYYLWIRPKPYASDKAEKVFSEALSAYMDAGLECEDLQYLVVCATENPDRYETAMAHTHFVDDTSTALSEALSDLELMLASGSVMPWSGKPMHRRSCELLLALPAEIGKTYAVIVDRISLLLEDESISPDLRDLYMWAITEMIRRDTQIIANLYVLACEPHMTGRYGDALSQTTLSWTGSEPSDEGHATLSDVDFSIYIPLTDEYAQAAADRSTEEILDDLEALREERGAFLSVIMGNT